MTYLLGQWERHIKVIFKEFQDLGSNALGVGNLIQSILSGPDTESDIVTSGWGDLKFKIADNKSNQIGGHGNGLFIVIPNIIMCTFPERE